MVKNLNLFILLCGALTALQGCKAPQNVEEPEPEKGQFKVVLTSDTGQTRAFWETDPDKRKLGEPCEQELHSVTILVYNQIWGTTDGPAYIRHFSPAELARKSSIFSLPHGTTASESNPKISFHAFANYKVKTTAIEGNLYGEDLGSLYEYFGLPESTTGPLVIDFASIYPKGPAAPAVALRDVANGKGFVMSSIPAVIQMSKDDDPNIPRTVHIELARTVSRIEINAHTTPAFADKYPGSTLVIKSLSISYLAKSSVLSIFPDTITPPTVDALLTLDQLPSNTTVDGTTHHNFIFYSYENTQRKTTTPQRQPQLDIIATFDFDGNPLTIDDATTIKYRKKLTMSNGNGSILRNTLYQVEVMLNGLSEREVISSIEILPWSTVYEEVNFGG